MDRRFPESEPPGYPGQSQRQQPEWPGYSGQTPPGWSGYLEQLREPEITQFPRFQEQRTKREWQPERKRTGLPRLFIVWLVIALLATAGASSLITMLLLRHPAFLQGARQTGTPVVPAGTPGAGQTPTRAAPTLPHGSLYTAQAGALFRFDLQSSQSQQPMQPTWTVQAADPAPPLVMGKQLFFENEQTPGSFLEAVNADTGQQLWKNTKYGSGFLLGSGNMLYDAGCIFTMDNVGTTICTLDGINASTGATLWSSPLSGGSAWIALQNGVIYVVSYTNYFAINASTGKIIWQRNLLHYIDQNANMTPTISGNVLSFASCNVTKQSRGASGCYLYAFNTSDGSELWHMYTTASIMISPAIMNGVLYASTMDGTLYALDEQSGKKLWTANVGGGNIGQVLASEGTIYVEIIDSNGQEFQIEAFNATTHKPRWGQSQNGASAIFKTPDQPVPLFATNHGVPNAPLAPFSAGPSDNPFILEGGLIYIHDSPTTISVLNASNGNTITQYPVQNIYGFTVVT